MKVMWDGLSIPMVPMSTSQNEQNFPTYFQCAHSARMVYATGTSRLLEAQYNRVDPEEVVQLCTHLSKLEKSDLVKLLSKFHKLFSGKLGRYVHQRFSISLKDIAAQPVFCQPYPIPLAHQEVFKKELQHLIDEKVLKRIARSEWAFPTFLIP